MDYLLATASAAEVLLASSHTTLPRTTRHAQHTGMAFDGQASALAWLETKLPSLMGLVRISYLQGRYSLCWQLVDAMWPHGDLVDYGESIAGPGIESRFEYTISGEGE